jgi:hypothetical protein
MAINEQLSQFASFVEVNDVSRNIGIATTATPYVGIGTTNPIAKFEVVGQTELDDVNISGIATVGSLSIGSSQVISSGRQLQNIASLDATTTATIEAAIVNAPNTFSDLIVTGIATFNSSIGVAGIVTTKELDVVGIATIETLSVQTQLDVYDSQAIFHNDVYIAGNLSIGGTSIAIIAQDLRVTDRDIVLGVTTNSFGGDISNDTTANHGGIAIASTEGNPLVNLSLAGFTTLPNTYKQLMWVRGDSYGFGTTDAWMFNYAVGIGSTLVPNGVRLAVSEIQFTDNTINTPNVNIAKDLRVSGVGTVTISRSTWSQIGAGLTFTTGIGTHLNISGIATVGSLSIGSSQVISSGRELQNIVSLDATTTATIEAAISNAPNTFSDLIVTGIATFNNNVGVAGIVTASALESKWAQVGSGLTFTTGIGTYLSISGVGTIANLSSGIATVTRVHVGIATTYSEDLVVSGNARVTGILTIGTGSITLNGNDDTINVGNGVTIFPSGDARYVGIITAQKFIGDGSELTGTISGVGIQSTGTLVGTGITTLNFTGSAIANITTSGNITTILLSSSGAAAGSQGQIQYNDVTAFAGSPNFTFDGNNVYVAGIVTATDFNSLSDINYKDNVETVNSALLKVEQLRGVKFDWKDSGRPSYGVIAQELETVLPELVHGDDPKTVNYNGIIGVLIEAIKELKQEIEDLKK